MRQGRRQRAIKRARKQRERDIMGTGITSSSNHQHSNSTASGTSSAGITLSHLTLRQRNQHRETASASAHAARVDVQEAKWVAKRTRETTWRFILPLMAANLGSLFANTWRALWALVCLLNVLQRNNITS